MFALLSLIPVIGPMIQGIATAYFNAKVDIAAARIGGDRDVALGLIKGQAVAEHERVSALSVIASSKTLLFIVVGFAAPFIIYEWKVVVWDITLGWGSTAAIKGNVAEWGTTIIVAIFGSSTTLTLGHMWFNRNQP